MIWRARNITSDQIITTYRGHELLVYPVRRFAWGATIDGGVWCVDDAPVEWPSEAAAMIGAIRIADVMDQNQRKKLRVMEIGAAWR